MGPNMIINVYLTCYVFLSIFCTTANTHHCMFLIGCKKNSQSKLVTLMGQEQFNYLFQFLDQFSTSNLSVFYLFILLQPKEDVLRMRLTMDLLLGDQNAYKTRLKNKSVEAWRTKRYAQTFNKEHYILSGQALLPLNNSSMFKFSILM